MDERLVIAKVAVGAAHFPCFTSKIECSRFVAVHEALGLKKMLRPSIAGAAFLTNSDFVRMKDEICKNDSCTVMENAAPLRAVLGTQNKHGGCRTTACRDIQQSNPRQPYSASMNILPVPNIRIQIVVSFAENQFPVI